jgi:hypothetical protein
MSDQVKIVPSVLKAQVEEGWKLKPLAEHYGLPVAQMTKALRALGLKIRKFHAPKFTFVEEATEENADIADIAVNAEEVVVEELTTNAPIQAENAQQVLEENTEQEQPAVNEENSQSADW